MVRLKSAIIAAAVFAAFAGPASALDNRAGGMQTYDCYCSDSSGYCMANYAPSEPSGFSCLPQDRKGQKACTGSCILKETTGGGSSGGGITRKNLPAAIGNGGDLPTLTPTP